MYSLNEPGAVVTHFEFGRGTPLCGWIGDDEECSADWSEVDCRDCTEAR